MNANVNEAGEAPEGAPADGLEGDVIEDPTIPIEVPDRIDRDAKLADRIFAKATKEGAGALGGKEIIRRKTRTFVLDGQSCSPDLFVDESGDYYDFEVTMRSLSSAEEIRALDGVNEPGAVPFALAKASLYAMNGQVLKGDRKDFFWEAFGMQGRQICLMAFQHIGSASGAALGKFQRSISVS